MSFNNASPRLVILAHSGQPPVEKLSSLFNQLSLDFQVVKHALGEELPPLDAVQGVVSLGAPLSVYEPVAEHPWLATEMAFVEQVLAAQKPMLGICFGCQMLAQIGGGEVHLGKQGREFGFVPVHTMVEEPHAFSALDGAQVFQAHGDSYTLPSTAKHLLRGDVYRQQAAQFADNVYGVQFHPEITPDVIEKWHIRGIEMGWPHAVNHSLTPAEHAQAARGLLAKTDVWFEGVLKDLFQRS